MSPEKKYWWENKFLRVKNGKLYLGSQQATEVARKCETPAFVYSLKQIHENYDKLLEAFKNQTNLEIRICYAMKANAHRDILKTLRACGAWIDAVSPGEVNEALECRFPPKKILFTGTSLSLEDLSFAFGLDGLTVNIDAFEQLRIMKEVRDKWFQGNRIRVSVRWNPGIGRGFNPKVVTAGKVSKNGIPIKFGIEEKKVIPTFHLAAEYGFVPIGLHQHLGSGWVKKDFNAVSKAVAKIVSKAGQLEKEGFTLEFLDFGGGFGPKYSKNDELFPVKKYVQYIFREIEKSRLKIKAVALEPGKYLVADAGVLLLRVEYIKESYGNLFVCVNGGTFNTLPRPAIYNLAPHEIVNCSCVDAQKTKPVTIAGNLCETGDVFSAKISMPLPKRGDILAVLCAGAYARSMASAFNLRPIPKEIFI